MFVVQTFSYQSATGVLGMAPMLLSPATAEKSPISSPVTVPKNGLRMSTINAPRMMKGSVPETLCFLIFSDDGRIRQRGGIERQDAAVLLPGGIVAEAEGDGRAVDRAIQIAGLGGLEHPAVLGAERV